MKPGLAPLMKPLPAVTNEAAADAANEAGLRPNYGILQFANCKMKKTNSISELANSEIPQLATEGSGFIQREARASFSRRRKPDASFIQPRSGELHC